MHAVAIATEHNSGSASGLAQFSFLQDDEGDHKTQAGAVVNVTFGAPGDAVAHELGHTMGLPHDDGRYPLTDPQVFTGLMNCGGGVLPILGQFEPCEGGSWWGIIDFQVPITPPYVWKTYIDSKSWPRPAGFGYTGETP